MGLSDGDGVGDADSVPPTHSVSHGTYAFNVYTHCGNSPRAPNKVMKVAAESHARFTVAERGVLEQSSPAPSRALT